MAALILLGLVGILLRFYRRSFINFLDATGPCYVGSHAPESPPFNGSIKVVSWNIHFGKAVDAAITTLGSVSALRNADVLLLQEMDEAGVARIAAALRYNYVYYPASIHSKTGRPFGNAVLSRWPIRKSVKIVLPHASPHRNQRRIAVGATLTIDNTEVVAYSVHTEIPILLNPWRSRQLAYMTRQVALKDNKRLIIGGDFNTFSRRSVRVLEKRMARWELVSVARRPQPTTAVAWFGFRPDHIFVRGLTPGDAGVSSGARASDHDPVWTILSWR